MIRMQSFENNPFRAGAAVALDKPFDDVTLAERERFKRAFLRVFSVKAPDLIQNMIDDLIIADAYLAQEEPEYVEAVRQRQEQPNATIK